MQASQATNETRLPRQVLKRSAEIQARLDAERAAREPENREKTAVSTASG